MTDNVNVMENTQNTQSVGEVGKDFAGENKQSEKGEKSFTQAQLENLISERLKRERKNNESLSEVKVLLSKLSDDGVLESKSYSDMAKELCARLNSGSNEDAKSDFQPEENSVGNTSLPLSDADISDEKDEEVLAENQTQDQKGTEQKTSEEQEQKDEDMMLEILHFKKNFPDTDINSLFENKAFLAFSKGRRQNLCSLYGDYISFMSALYGDGQKSERREDSESFSTSFSARSKSYGNDYSGILSKRQMEIAKSEGMSYREYAELLSNIPSKKNVNV